jgi:lipopolysaccharide transport system ATP-binding protein
MSETKQNDDVVIKIEGLKKKYRLGTIGGGTLTADLQSWWAKKRGKEDPNSIIGTDTSKYGQSFYALNGIDLDVRKGEAVGIIGHNGAGKSTLLKILSRVTAPTEGTAKIKGRISSMLEVGTGFHPELTGRENIYMNGAILGMTRKEVDSKIDEIIEFSECAQFIDTPVKRYSSGMYVKLAFAVSAHLDAEIMIMDEVLAVGDVKFQKKCLGKMGDAASSEGKTVLYVSHNMNTIRQLCNRCIVLDHGVVIYDGDVETAIGIYVDQKREELVSHFDMEDVKRPTGFHGVSLRIHEFDFVDKKDPIYVGAEPMIFDVEYTAFSSGDELGIYFTVCNEDETTVGTTQLQKFELTEKDVRKKRRFRFDISNLAEGRYFFEVDLFYGNEYGTLNSVDHPSRKIYFEKRDDDQIKSICWLKKYYGSVRLNYLTLVENEDNHEAHNS